jgi:hypothetical protein
MAIHTELNIRLANSPGALAAVCRVLGDERVDVVAMALESGGQLRLVVDNHVRGIAVLRDHHHQVVERPVLVVSLPDTPGALAPQLALLSDAGVNVDYAYGGASGDGALVVVGVADAMRASAAAGF